MNQQFRIPGGSPVRPVQKGAAPAVRRLPPQEASFATILDTKLKQSKVKFSAHATKRLQARQIQFSEGQLDALQEAVEKARNKGGKETLILLGDVALVVSVANRTVITAVDGDSLKDNVFTQIDSAVIT